MIKRKTAKGRLRDALQRVKQWLVRNRHLKVEQQYAALSAKLKGHYSYYCITANSRTLWRFQRFVVRLWKKWLGRRGGRGHNWEKLNRLLKRYALPDPMIHHAL